MKISPSDYHVVYFIRVMTSCKTLDHYYSCRMWLDNLFNCSAIAWMDYMRLEEIINEYILAAEAVEMATRADDLCQHPSIDELECLYQIPDNPY